MTKKVTFILGIHNHQPVGNFYHVIEDAYKKAYLPFLQAMNQFPDVPFALHNSGILWDWISSEHGEYLDMLDQMIERGQVELLSAGYYEPILSVIPKRDRIGQLRMMNSFIRDNRNSIPRGCWLTERIWEPHLPDTLKKAGLEYVVVDDSHFKSIGLDQKRIRGVFNTEENGSYIKIFPIDEKLRYLIPFSDPEETISYLRAIGDSEVENPLVVLADDGEKFGVWPGTHSLCYGEGWLKRFLEALRGNMDWLEVKTFSSALEEFKSLGIVYIPTASYSEMMEWALPLSAQIRHRRAADILKGDEDFKENPTDVIRGGFWRNFLVKYEESNWMHKRMMEASGLVEDYGKSHNYDKSWKEARNHLYQAQCNCAYWHGLFGGLYLPHLRSAVFKHIIESESIIEEASEKGNAPKVRIKDLDGDGVKEVSVRTRDLRLIFKARGGGLREFDIRKPAFNITDIIRRREEIYHKRIKDSQVEGSQEVKSIHEINSAKEKDLDSHLIYDPYQRMSLLDHFVFECAGVDDFMKNDYLEGGDFIDSEYTIEPGAADSAEVTLGREGRVVSGKDALKVSLAKSIKAGGESPGLSARYSIRPLDGDLRCSFIVENVFSLLAGDAPDRYYQFPGRTLSASNLASKGEEVMVEEMFLVDEWMKYRIKLTFSPSAEVWRFPIRTVSNSEGGYESVYQGSVVAAVWPLEVPRGEQFECILKFDVERL